MNREQIKTELEEMILPVESLRSLMQREALINTGFLKPENTLKSMGYFIDAMITDFDNLPTDILLHNLNQLQTHFLWIFQTYCERPDDKIIIQNLN